MKAISERDLGFAKVVSELKSLSGKEIKIGVQGSDTYEDGTSVLDVAIWNEFGTSRISSRPFVRQTFALYGEEAYQQMAKVVEAVGIGVDVNTALATVGQWYENRMKETLSTYPWKRNSLETIKRKGSSKPLIDTGQLRNSIRYEVK